MEITTVGIDLAKNVFQVHAVSRCGEVIVQRALRRAQVIPFFAKLPSCLIGMEACGTSHHWARELVALGHEVRLMPPVELARGFRARPSAAPECGGGLGGGRVGGAGASDVADDVEKHDPESPVEG